MGLLQSVEGDVPDAGNGGFGVGAVGVFAEFGVQTPTVVVETDAAVLGEVSAGLLDRQGK